MLIIDFLWIYLFYAVIAFYYLLCDQPSEHSNGFRFLNNTFKYSFLSFGGIHIITCILPGLCVYLSRMNHDYFMDENYFYRIGFANKIGIFISIILQLYYLRLALGPRTYVTSGANSDMTIAYISSRGVLQFLFNIILIVLLCVNNDGMEVTGQYAFMKWLPVYLCGFSYLLALFTTGILINQY